MFSRMFRSSRVYDPMDLAGLRTFDEEDKGGDFGFYGVLVDAVTGDPSPVLRRLVDSLFTYIDRHAEPHHTGHIEPMKVAWYSRVMGDASPEVYTRHPWYLRTYYEAMKIPYEFVLSPNHPGEQVPILSREGYLSDWLCTIRTEPKDGFMALRRAIDRFHLVDPLTGYRFPLLPWKSLPQSGSAALRSERERWHSRSHERLQQVMHQTSDMYEQHAERRRDRLSSRYMGSGTYIGGGMMDVNPNSAYIYNRGPSSRAFMGGAQAEYMHGGYHGSGYGGYDGYGHGHGHGHGHGSYGHSPYSGYAGHAHGSHSHHDSYASYDSGHSHGHSLSGSHYNDVRRSRPPSRETSRERERERERERQIEREYEQEREKYSTYGGSNRSGGGAAERERRDTYGSVIGSDKDGERERERERERDRERDRRDTYGSAIGSDRDRADRDRDNAGRGTYGSYTGSERGDRVYGAYAGSDNGDRERERDYARERERERQWTHDREREGERDRDRDRDERNSAYGGSQGDREREGRSGGVLSALFGGGGRSRQPSPSGSAGRGRRSRTPSDAGRTRYSGR